MHHHLKKKEKTARFTILKSHFNLRTIISLFSDQAIDNIFLLDNNSYSVVLYGNEEYVRPFLSEEETNSQVFVY